MRLDGFLIDLYSPSVSLLEVEVDCSHLDWDTYKDLIVKLEDLLSDIDERHSVKSKLVRGRSLSARYRRVSAEDRRRRLRFSPLPSKYSNLLANTKAYIYRLVDEFCVVLEEMKNRKLYLLPKATAPAFLEVIDEINREIVDRVNREIREFVGSDDFMSIEAVLANHNIDPSILRLKPYIVYRYRVSLLPVDFGYSINGDMVYQQMERRKAMKGLELLRRQIEEEYRRYAENIVRELTSKLVEIAEAYDNPRRKMKALLRRLRRLRDVSASLELKDMTTLIDDILEILETRSLKERTSKMIEKFNTTSLKEAVSRRLGINL